jgi:hypothetical protein
LAGFKGGFGVMRQYIKWSSIIAMGIIGLFLTGCASSTKITMTQEKYAPSFRANDYSRYKGKKLAIASFYNQAQNTKAYNYFSADKKYVYEGNATLENYYLYCFQKAFRHIGVSLVDYTYDNNNRYHHGHRYGWWGAPGPGAFKAPRGVAEFQFVLLSLNDQEFKFKALLFKDGEAKFDKDYTVTMAEAGTENAAQLEKRAYSLVDLAFTTIMKDRDFQKAF